MGMDNYTIKNMQLRDVEDRKDSRKKFNDILPLAECKTENSVFKAPIYDLSSSGVFIRTSRQFSIGQEIAMTITFPVPIATLRVTGIVVRTHRRESRLNSKFSLKKNHFIDFPAFLNPNVTAPIKIRSKSTGTNTGLEMAGLAISFANIEDL